jgi:hypothetical protein
VRPLGDRLVVRRSGPEATARRAHDERRTWLVMPRSTTSIRLPDDLVEARDALAAARDLTRSQISVQAVEQVLADRSAGSPAFPNAIGTPRPDLHEVVEEMMEAIREPCSRDEAPELRGTRATPARYPHCAASRTWRRAWQEHHARTSRSDRRPPQRSSSACAPCRPPGAVGRRGCRDPRSVRRWAAFPGARRDQPGHRRAAGPPRERGAADERFDLAIAVHATTCGLTLVTADRAFERLELPRENWLVRGREAPHRGRRAVAGAPSRRLLRTLAAHATQARVPSRGIDRRA